MDEPSAYGVKYLDGEEEEQVYVSRAGRALVTYGNGDTYEGDFNDKGQKHGNGTYTWAKPEEEDGDDELNPNSSAHTYSGEWKDGVKSGVGKLRLPDGGCYFGNWSENEMHGDGAYKYPNGDIYSGSYSHNQRHGFGRYLFKSSDSCLEGTWASGDMVTGKWVHRDGTSFAGTFKDGFPCGEGKFSFRSGNVQSGEFIRVVDVSHPTDEEATVPRWLGGEVSSG